MKVLALINQAKDAGATWLRVEFDGSGDDGDIGDIIMTADKEDWNAEIPGNPLDPHSDNILRDFLYYKVNDAVGMHGDWVNNQGGYGTLWWDLSNNKFSIEYYQRTTEDIDIPEEPMFA
tara:strand:+ start:1017 stop:1373 length:357 start_codon:yes stop_codon:yes gene_type:complete